MIATLIIILITFLISFFNKKTFGKNIPLTLMSIPLILYLSQFIFKTFNLGIWLIIILAILGLIFTIFKLLKKDKQYLQNIFSKGFFSFILIIFLIYLTDYQQQFSAWDELAHWGEMVKEMLRLDKFYATPESLMIWHKEYPPFISLFELFYCRLSTYSEELMNISLHTYMFGLIIPYLVDKYNKKINIFILPLLTLSIILMLDPYQIFKTIQTDLLISLMSVYPFLLIIFEEPSPYKNLNLILSITALLLVKQIGIPLALMVITFYLLYEFIFRRSSFKNLKIYFQTLLIIFIPLILYFIWVIYTKNLQTDAQFSLSNINVLEYLNIAFKNQGIPYKLQAFSLFKQYLFTESVIIKPFKIGYIYSYIIVIILLTILHFINKEEFNLKKLLLIIFIFTCGTIGYAFVISVLYMFCFSEGETIALASFGRYMASYVLIEFLFIFLFFCYLIRNKKHYNLTLISLTLILLLGINTNLKCLLPQKYFGNNYVEFKEIATKINNNTENNSKIYIVMQDTSYSYLLQYFLESRPIEKNYNYLYNNVLTYKKDEVIDCIMQNDYFYLNEVTTDFIKNYQDLFSDEIKEKSLYKIDKENKKLIFVV